MIAASLLMARTTMPVDSSVAVFSRVSVVKEAFWRVERMLTNSQSNLKIFSEGDRHNVHEFSDRNIKNITMKNVNVSYSKDGPKILENLNLEITSGEVITIVGNSGVGKTTFIKLLSGLINYEGEIKFDNIELNDMSSNDSYDFIGYLPQDVLMLPGTIAENISNFRTPDSNRVIEVTKLVGIHEFILKLLEVMTAFEGLSKSFWRRKAKNRLARLFTIIQHVCLDEPNSALDHSER